MKCTGLNAVSYPDARHLIKGSTVQTCTNTRIFYIACYSALIFKTMSGGHFDYNQYRINDIADSIERELNRQGKEKPNDELYGDAEYFKKYPEERFYYTYPEIVQEKMKEAIKALKIAAIYAQRVDWFLSGDDGEESFIERLNDELNAL